ncbi:hypothetical protein N7519_008285 [Penicillium mononematosum]|uniref:uncharacterized protein n=1 Tax=Penicillium mononematosum TaxID=268346 RepID=UPI0025485CAA|nr:uncharacterized protein N7519_008285 [Penicillium mononematosum]KAJ6177824.1 hypothetical protein N7519_008285 [Penicillium mononematosum]
MKIGLGFVTLSILLPTSLSDNADQFYYSGMQTRAQGGSKEKSERNNTRLGAWRSPPDSLRYQSGASLYSVGNSLFYPSSFRIGIQPSKPPIFLVKMSPATMYESESGRDRPFQAAPPCYMGLSSCYWLSYIQHGVSHDVLTSQLEEYPS